MFKKRITDKIEKLKSENLFREIKVFEGSRGGRAKLAGREYLVFCSNDYLGLSQHPELKNAMRGAVERFGAGACASRLVSGSTSAHSILEEKLKNFMQAEAVLLFNSGYAANIGIIPAITGKGDILLCDKLNHASLVDGCLLSKAEFRRYRHLDMEALEKLLVKYRFARERWIITDGLFSMDGDIAPLPDICGLAKKYDARIYLDDAHAFGVLGANGRGTPELFENEGKIDVLVGTLGKAAGVSGAFACGSAELYSYLINHARSFIYSTAIPPAIAMGAVTAVDILGSFTKERERFLEIVKDFNSKMAELNIASGSKSYIIPIVTGNAGTALELENSFWSEAVYVQAIRPPTVPEGSSRLRLTLTLSQQEDDRKKVLAILASSTAIL